MAAKRITREQVEEKLTLWLQRLDLLHWEIRIDFDTAPDVPEALMEIDCHPQFDRATIFLRPDWREWKVGQPIGDLELTLDYLVCHELIHPMMRNLDVAAINDLDKLAHPDALAVFIEVYNRNRENLVDRLARSLVEGWGPA